MIAKDPVLSSSDSILGDSAIVSVAVAFPAIRSEPSEVSRSSGGCYSSKKKKSVENTDAHINPAQRGSGCAFCYSKLRLAISVRASAYTYVNPEDMKSERRE